MNVNAQPGDTPVLELRSISKHFGPVVALNDVSLPLHAGEGHVLLGENGAGKSTLVGTILGKHRPTKGEILFRGEPVEFASTRGSHDLGIRAVTQEFALCESLSVSDNLFLGQEPSRFGFRKKREARTKSLELLRKMGARIDPSEVVGNLTRAEQQLVEITKAVTQADEPGVILFDEPTASISAVEAERLFELIDSLKADGWAILYISHRMEELRRVGERVTVLRDGKWVSSYLMSEIDDATLINDMAGRETAQFSQEKWNQTIGSSPVLEVERLNTVNGKVLDVGFNLYPGEVLGIGGLVGSGKGDVGKALFGLTRVKSGVVRVKGSKVSKLSPTSMYRAGFGIVPEDRKREGLFGQSTVAQNIVVERLANSSRYSLFGLLRKDRMAKDGEALSAKYDIRPSNLSRMVISFLSGGNQQKALIARALSAPREVIIVIEPTVGVDIGSRLDIYQHLKTECESGTAVLLISSDAEELVNLCDRVLVMNTGSLVSELRGDSITQDNIVAASFGTGVES